MPTNLGDPLDLGLGDVYFQWAQNLGLTPTSKGLGELLGLLASAAAGQSAQGTTDLSSANTVSANISRTGIASGAVALTSGTLQLEAVYLTKGQVINNINWISGTTAAVTPTHEWGVIANSARVVLATTNDLLTAAIGSFVNVSWPLTTPAPGPLTITTTGIYYVGILVVAGTTPSMSGSVNSSATPASLPPILSGTSNTGLAAGPLAVGTTLTAITATAGIGYVYLT